MHSRKQLKSLYKKYFYGEAGSDYIIDEDDDPPLHNKISTIDSTNGYTKHSNKTFSGISPGNYPRVEKKSKVT